jgi:hypothetical protein
MNLQPDIQTVQSDTSRNRARSNPFNHHIITIK